MRHTFPSRAPSLLSMTRRSGAQVTGPALDGRATRHTVGWRELHAQRPPFSTRAMRAIPRIVLVAAALLIVGRGVGTFF